VESLNTKVFPSIAKTIFAWLLQCDVGIGVEKQLCPITICNSAEEAAISIFDFFKKMKLAGRR